MARVRLHALDEFVVSAITSHELFFGAFKSPRKTRNLASIDELNFRVLDFDKDDGRQAGQVRAALATAGTPIGPYDLLIAGQALSRNLILITHNTREFSRVSGLQIEDWEA